MAKRDSEFASIRAFNDGRSVKSCSTSNSRPFPEATPLKRGVGKGKTDQDLPEGRPEILELLELFDHLRCVLADQRDHAAEFVIGRKDEIGADVIVFRSLDFSKEFPLRRIVEDHPGSSDIFCYVVDPPARNDLPVAEDPLATSDLSVKQLGDGITLAFPSKWPPDSREQ